MKVYYNGSFWEHKKYERAGKELPLKTEFLWDETNGQIPAVYLCKEGMTADLAFRIPRSKVEKYLEDWTQEKRLSGLTDEEYERLERESPFSLSFRLEVNINGKEAVCTRMYGTVWHPCERERENIEEEAEEMMEYYGFSKEDGWQFIRAAIPWPDGKKPEKIVSLSFRLKASLVPESGEHFRTEEPFEESVIVLTHPVTGQKHRLFLHQFESCRMSDENIRDLEKWEYPEWYRVLEYHSESEVSADTFQIRDCSRGERPRLKENADPEVSADKNSTVTQISVFPLLERKSDDNADRHLKTACSSVHFVEIPVVEWRVVYYTKEKEDLDIICM